MPIDSSEFNESSRPEEEKEQRIIQLNEEFLLFQDLVEGDYIEHAILAIDETQSLPVNFTHFRSQSKKRETITPFHPINGSRIDPSDYAMKSRIKKITALNNINELIDGKLDSDCIDIGNRDLKTRISADNKLKDILKRLRIRLSFPGSGNLLTDEQGFVQPTSYEAKPWSPGLDAEDLMFNFFYPSDYGPLPTMQGQVYNEGFRISIPSDPEIRNQIIAKFYLVPEEENGDSTSEPEMPPAEPISGGFIRSKK